MWKFKSWKGKDKCLFLLSVGVILCILAFPVEHVTGKLTGGKAAGNDHLIRTASGSAVPVGSEPMDSAWSGQSQSLAADALQTASAAASTYESILERRIQEMLKHVEGVGNVDVLIVLKSSAEKVLHTDENGSRSATEEKDTSGGVRRIESEEQEKTAVFSGTDSGRTPVVEKELYPEISGIVISATGGGNPTVSAEISAAMEALFGLPAHKIKVLKRVE